MKNFKCSANGQIFDINHEIKCTTKNVIYVICCTKCNQQYVGKTSGTFRARMDAHRSAINNSKDTAVSRHFRQPGHELHNFLSFPIEIVFGDVFTIGARERFWINKLDVISKGFNCNRTYV